MGKTESGAVWLNAAMLKPYDYYQYWRNADDAMVGTLLRRFTTLPLDEIKKLEALKDREINEAKKILADAKAVAEAGAFCIVLEGVMEGIADQVAAEVPVPIIGIGASPRCDGQVLVTEDMLGLFERTPRFVKRYADLASEIGEAVGSYAEEVRSRTFPTADQTYRPKA